MRNQSGQVVLILVLVMTVALAIGISVIQRSLSDISTSSKVEQSSRAFSAAEAGIEKALSCPGCAIAPISFENQSGSTVTNTDAIPVVPASTNLQGALGIPPLSKDEVAQVWLADPNANLPTCTATDICYKGTSLDIYWGDPVAVSDKAALEITIIYHNGTSYQSKKWYLDSDSTRATATNFQEPTSCRDPLPLIGYRCWKRINSLPSGLMLLRARLLYNSGRHPFAVQAVGNCSTSASEIGNCIPPQARKIISTGTAGNTQRKVQVFNLDKVVPPYFDYAIFSAGAINK